MLPGEIARDGSRRSSVWCPVPFIDPLVCGMSDRVRQLLHPPPYFIQFLRFKCVVHSFFYWFVFVHGSKSEFYWPFLNTTIKVIRNLSVFNAEYVLGSYLVVVYVHRTVKLPNSFQKNKAFSFVKSLFFFFQKRFSSSDHSNVVTTNINTYFDYILAKLGIKMVTIKQNYGCARVPADIGKISLK